MVNQMEKEVIDLIFKDKEEIKLTKENIEEFCLKDIDSAIKAVREKNKIKTESEERSFSGDGLKPEDVNKCAENVMLDIGSHLSHLDFVEMLLRDYKEGKTTHKPLYSTQEQVDKYKVELARLFHSLSIKLRLASMFGFGNIEGAIAVVDTKKLPTPEEAKKMHKEKMRKILKEATDAKGKIDNKSSKTFKES